ncbi:hypothetical protein N8I74_15410 [Chitiniphilus purpureus]|uniref:Uncharacterized protein n=1 Tax=Chitiniphilus purpureus TaxID=2981137 RepID=A0ABY6DK05_9NEIS|nr:hypothetical protein [Chitiniphilus sp. CD1]UXY14692.1 hypothetical protein N8I74_15410 [Chitiniphilus sp. CD1]
MNAGTAVITQHLALGLALMDAASGQPALMPLTVSLDELPPARRPPLTCLPSNRFVLRYHPRQSGTAQPLVVRLVPAAQGRYAPPSAHRMLLPRRLALTLPTLAQAEAAAPGARACRVWLFPGPAYPIWETATGVRIHAVRNPGNGLPRRPARWVRLVASVPAAQADLAQASIVARGCGDERGEVLLLLPPAAAQPGNGAAMSVRLTLFAPPEPVPPDAGTPQRDPLWDVPLETPAGWGPDDAVLAGAELPPGYVPVAHRVVNLRLGVLARGLADLAF